MNKDHVWIRLDWMKWTACKVCGIVKRADGKNKPCRGPVKIGLRS